MNIERARAAVSAGDMSFVDLGQGPAVVLLHGWPASSYLWRREIPLLATRMRVIAPDLIGYGDSARPKDADLSLEAQAGYVQELLRALEIDEFAVVGHGFGGGIAQLLAVSAGASALALVDSVAFDAWPSASSRELQALEPGVATPELVREIVGGWLSRAAVKRPPAGDIAAAYIEPWLRDPASLLRAVRGLDGKGLAGRESELSALGASAFVLWGEEDAFLPPSLAERLGEVFDGSMVALLPGCGHLVTEDAPETVWTLLYEFLRLRYLGQPHAHAEPGPVPVFLHRPTPAELREAGLPGYGIEEDD